MLSLGIYRYTKMNIRVICLISIFVSPVHSLDQILNDVYDDVYDDVTMNYSKSMTTGVFCEEYSEEECGSFIEQLHELLSSVSLMVSTSEHITFPVKPVVTLFDNEMLQTSITDNYVSLSLERFEKEDTRHANIAKKRLQSGQETQTDQLHDITNITTQIRRLRISLSVFTQNLIESESFYGSDSMHRDISLKLLAPIVRAIGSLFQRTLFNWQLSDSKQLDFYHRLLGSERRYLELFFELYGYELYNLHFGLWTGNRMSSYTWSHRSTSTSSSLRFACGTTSQEEPFALYARDVLIERSIDSGHEIEQVKDGLSFYGLGWDLEANNFKLYLKFRDVDILPDTYKSLATNKLQEVEINFSQIDIAQYGLVSLTYYNSEKSESILHEIKVYLYPTENELIRHYLKTEQSGHRINDSLISNVELYSSITNVAWLMASKRGFIEQFDIDVSKSSLWRSIVGENGNRIIDRYNSIHLKLETIAYQSNDSWTMYFPVGSG